MKLLCVTPSYWPAFQYGGPIASNHNLNIALVRKGINVTVYTTNVGLCKKVPLNQEVDIDGVKVTYFSFVKVFEFIGQTGWQFSLKMSKAIKDNINSFDLISLSAIYNYPTFITAYYCKRYNKPYITIPKRSLYPYSLNKKKWKKWLYYIII